MRPSLVGFTLSLALHVVLAFVLLSHFNLPVRSSGSRSINLSLSVFKTADSVNSDALVSPLNTAQESALDQSALSQTTILPDAVSQTEQAMTEEAVVDDTTEPEALPESDSLPPIKADSEPVTESASEQIPTAETETSAVIPPESIVDNAISQDLIQPSVVENPQSESIEPNLGRVANQAKTQQTSSPIEINPDTLEENAVFDIESDHELQRYQAKVRQRIEQAKFYPRKAKRLRKQGVVSVRFAITQSGQVIELKIESSSDVAALDQAALDAVTKSSPFPPLPAHYPNDHWRFEVMLIYDLN